ncbi:Cellular repressor of transcription domain-containing protein [Dioscorea alata]|uniref:Cellular repressor of transcription domain-containing protein n=1 Tax=Dioscorea alata TaxID=55571 RepID=A0ACB7VKN1_DIOAL|nr:Cellular repressor of transcription domain-containing protein [Dioscorea alata]
MESFIRSLFFFLLAFFVLFILQFPLSVIGAYPGKPAPSDAAATARWLASQNSWGVLSTISIDLEGAPFGNVASFSDGLPGEGLGVPYFYLTTLDPTARDVQKDERSSFTISEFPIGSCGVRDPENPACAKLTLTGKLKLVDVHSAEWEFAKLALFSKHPEMESWPEEHRFQIFKLDIENIFLVDWFGGAKHISPAQYLDYIMNQDSSMSQA